MRESITALAAWAKLFNSRNAHSWKNQTRIGFSVIYGDGNGMIPYNIYGAFATLILNGLAGCRWRTISRLKDEYPVEEKTDESLASPSGYARHLTLFVILLVPRWVMCTVTCQIWLPRFCNGSHCTTHENVYTANTIEARPKPFGNIYFPHQFLNLTNWLREIRSRTEVTSIMVTNRRNIQFILSRTFFYVRFSQRFIATVRAPISRHFDRKIRPLARKGTRLSMVS